MVLYVCNEFNSAQLKTRSRFTSFAFIPCTNTSLWSSSHRHRLVCISHSSEKPKVWLVVLLPLLLLSSQPSPACLSQVTEISMGEFLMHSSVVWLNPHPSLGRMRKDPEMTVFGESARWPLPPLASSPDESHVLLLTSPNLVGLPAMF